MFKKIHVLENILRTFYLFDELLIYVIDSDKGGCEYIAWNLESNTKELLPYPINHIVSVKDDFFVSYRENMGVYSLSSRTKFDAYTSIRQLEEDFYIARNALEDRKKYFLLDDNLNVFFDIPKHLGGPHTRIVDLDNVYFVFGNKEKQCSHYRMYKESENGLIFIKSFEIDWLSFQDYKNKGNVSQKCTFKELITIYNNNLYYSVTDKSIVVMNHEGNIIKHINSSNGGQINMEDERGMVENGIMDSNKETIMSKVMGNQYFWNLKSDTVTKIDVRNSFPDSASEGGHITYFDDDILAGRLLPDRQGVIIVDKETHELLYLEEMTNSVGNNLLTLEVKVAGDYMVVYDSSRRLHIYQKEDNINKNQT